MNKRRPNEIELLNRFVQALNDVEVFYTNSIDFDDDNRKRMYGTTKEPRTGNLEITDPGAIVNSEVTVIHKDSTKPSISLPNPSSDTLIDTIEYQNDSLNIFTIRYYGHGVYHADSAFKTAGTPGDPSGLIDDAVTVLDKTWSSSKIDSTFQLYTPLSQSGAANGYAPLGADSIIPSQYLPPLASDRSPFIVVANSGNADYTGNTHTPIQNALNQIGTGSGTIYIKSGTYVVSTQLTKTAGNVRVIMEDGVNISTSGTPGSVFLFSNVVNVHFKGGNISVGLSNADSAKAIDLAGSMERVVIEDVTVTNAPDSAVNVQSSVTENLTIKNNRFTTTKNAIDYTTSGSNGELRIENNYLFVTGGSTYSCIRVNASANLTFGSYIVGNSLYGGGCNGITYLGSPRNTTIVGNSGTGIVHFLVSDEGVMTNTNLSNNTVRDNTGAFFYTDALGQALYLTMDANIIYSTVTPITSGSEGAINGIFVLRNPQYVTITNNFVDSDRDPFTFLLSSTSDNVLISNNIFNDTNAFSIKASANIRAIANNANLGNKVVYINNVTSEDPYDVRDVKQGNSFSQDLSGTPIARLDYSVGSIFHDLNNKNLYYKTASGNSNWDTIPHVTGTPTLDNIIVRGSNGWILKSIVATTSSATALKFDQPGGYKHGSRFIPLVTSPTFDFTDAKLGYGGTFWYRAASVTWPSNVLVDPDFTPNAYQLYEYFLDEDESGQELVCINRCASIATPSTQLGLFEFHFDMSQSANLVLSASDVQEVNNIGSGSSAVKLVDVDGQQSPLFDSNREVVLVSTAGGDNKFLQINSNLGFANDSSRTVFVLFEFGTAAPINSDYAVLSFETASSDTNVVRITYNPTTGAVIATRNDGIVNLTATASTNAYLPRSLNYMVFKYDGTNSKLWLNKSLVINTANNLLGFDITTDLWLGEPAPQGIGELGYRAMGITNAVLTDGDIDTLFEELFDTYQDAVGDGIGAMRIGSTSQVAPWTHDNV